MAAEHKESDNAKKAPKKPLKKIKVKILEQGDNKLYPKDGDTIIVNYTTRYYGGDDHKKLADSGERKSFIVGKHQMNAGWEECFKERKISLGATVQLKMPQSLCYEYAHDMLFEIELLQINDSKRQIAPFEELKVIMITEGDNQTFANKNDYVIVHYDGFYHGGEKHKEKFDSSRDRDKRFGFKVGKGQVIKGWDEGILKLSKGSKAWLQVPYSLAYGEQGSKALLIPKKQDLLFEVEVIDIDANKK
mmetsp:Transcript_13891/g.21756  ORF Transcript_13891/g.21756 Transcript_13891/m.21756 type:complete len:247 (+) Transcript_13891:33-773(+)